MTFALGLFFFAVSVAPMVYVLSLLFVKQTKVALPLGLIAAASAAFLFLRAHEGIISGLDDAAYRNMAKQFAEGAGFFDNDSALASIPQNLRLNFFYRPQMRSNLTRDRSFRVADISSGARNPAFIPTLALASSAAGRLLGSVDFFVPLLSSLFFAALLFLAWRTNGVFGIVLAIAAAITTPWPAWFCRGHFPEVAGMCLIGGALAAALGERKPRTFLLGVMLGLGVTFHMFLLPFALATLVLIFGGASIAGFVLGALPLALMTHFVCAPYGDWTRLANLRVILATPVHAALAITAAATAVALCIIYRRKENFFTSENKNVTKIERLAWGAGILALVVFAKLFFPKGAHDFYGGIRISSLIIFAFVLGFALLRERRALLMMFAAGILLSVFSIFVKNMEVPVGIWSQRRFAPVILFFLPLICAVRLPRKNLAVTAACAAVILLCSARNLLRHPAPWYVANEHGQAAFLAETSRLLEPADLVFFDYFPHSVPFAAEGGKRVFGFSEKAPETARDDVNAWLAAEATSNSVFFVSSYGKRPPLPCENVGVVTGKFDNVKSPRNFFPAERHTREAILTISKISTP